MVTSLLLLLSAHKSLTPMVQVSGNMEWEEPAYVQKIRGYHPFLRFNPGSTFLFKTPYYIAEGKYDVQAGHYVFRTVTAIQLGNAEIDKLAPEMPPEANQKLRREYAESMRGFEADYDQANGVLNLTYAADGRAKMFALHAYTEGDDQRLSTVSGAEWGLPGLWNAPEPFPDKLDARTRYRIGGIEGLQQFANEAMASDAAQFNLLDLRVDKTFRLHDKEGTWKRSGSTLTLKFEDGEQNLTISADGRKLLSRGKAAYTRG